jgi:hypothetical protein
MDRAVAWVVAGRWVTICIVTVVGAVLTITTAVNGPSFGALGFASSDLASYAVIPIPGTRTVHLPKGTAQASFDALTGEVASLPLPDLSLGVHPVAGGPDPKVTVARSTTTNSGGESETLAAEIHVATAGDYRVSITGGGNYNAPKLLLGRSDTGNWLPIALITVIVDVAVFLVTALVLRSLRRRPGVVAAGAGSGAGSERSVLSIELPRAAGAEGDGHGDGSAEDRLARLERLHEAGTVSDEEYAAERRRILDSL